MKNKTIIHNPVDRYSSQNENSYLEDILDYEKGYNVPNNKCLKIISISIPESTIKLADRNSKRIRMSRSSFTSVCLEYCCKKLEKDKGFFSAFFNNE